MEYIYRRREAPGRGENPMYRVRIRGRSASDGGCRPVMNIGRRVPLLFVLLALCAAPAWAQVDVSGLWRPLPRNQDGSGMTGDAAGVPLSAEGQWRAQSWSPDDFDTAEWVCRPHVWDYSLEGPLSAMRLWADTDEADAENHRLPRPHQSGRAGNDDLDGRPASSAGERAAHLERILDRRMGRRRAGRHDHPSQRGVHPALGTDAER